MTSPNRSSVLAALLVILSLPLLVALVEAASFRAANRSNGTLISSGEEREYLLYVPSSYHHDKVVALVISLHGAALWPAAQMRISEWNEEAERQGFLVVYPSGLKGRGPRIWRADGGADLARDVTFISELIDTISAAYSIDANRIFVNGFSNGGGMTFALSCTLSDRIAAVGMVDAAHLLPWRWCTDRRAVPMIAFHGTGNGSVPYQGGKSWISVRPFPSIVDWTANWAQRNGCAQGPSESVVAADVRRFEYSHCPANADIVLYRIDGGGHTWPGGGPLPEWFVGTTSHGVDATREMWKFFQEHPLLAR